MPARFDAWGNPVKDANGCFINAGLVNDAVLEKRRLGKFLIYQGFPALGEGRENLSQGREAVTLSCGNPGGGERPKGAQRG
jgi:hypothetical protein